MNDPTSILPSPTLDRGTRRVLWAIVAVGVIAFTVAFVTGNEDRAWLIYYVNFVMWTAIAQGGIVFSAAYRMTNGTWGEPFRRAGESMVSYLPLSFLLFLGVFFGRHHIYPWLHEATGKEAWLNTRFFFTRDAVIFLFMMWLSYKYVKTSLRPDLGLLRHNGPQGYGRMIDWLTKGWKGEEQEVTEGRSRISKLVPGLLISFAVCYSFLGFDLLMSLAPHWASTLFGWLFFLHGFYGGLVVITILSIWAMKSFGIESGYSTKQFHDLGRLLMGFCMLSGGFYWSQYLVIWYGNITEEIPYLLERFRDPLWKPLTWYYIVFAFFFPLAVFLSRKVKEKPWMLMLIAAIILSSLFVERFLAVAPYLWHEQYLPFGLSEFLISLGFASGFALIWFKFVSIFPLVPKKI